MTEQAPPNGTDLHQPTRAELQRMEQLRTLVQTFEAQTAQNIANLVRQMPEARSNVPLQSTALIIGQLIGLMFTDEVGKAFIADVIHKALEQGRDFHAMKSDEQKIEVLQSILQPVANADRRIVLPDGAVH